MGTAAALCSEWSVAWQPASSSTHHEWHTTLPAIQVRWLGSTLPSCKHRSLDGGTGRSGIMRHTWLVSCSVSLSATLWISPLSPSRRQLLPCSLSCLSTTYVWLCCRSICAEEELSPSVLPGCHVTYQVSRGAFKPWVFCRLHMQTTHTSI